MKTPFRLAIAGGGTGGHVFPGIAVAEALSRMGPVKVLWIGTGRPVERDALALTGWDYKTLAARPIAGRDLRTLFLSLATLPAKVAQAALWLRSFAPHAVFGVGGYVSGPVVLAARLLRIPTAIHEQNSVPGLANRLASRVSDLAFVSFRETGRHLRAGRVIHTGNPVRAAIAGARKPPGDDHAGRPFRLLVIGGSQGASSLNSLVASAVENLRRSGLSIEVYHQTGPADQKKIETLYGNLRINARVSPFITDIHEAYVWADLVVCRAGAGTIAEITALGKPSILIPYPFAAAGHQEANARELSDAGGAIFFTEDAIGAVRLAGVIQGLGEDREGLKAMGETASRFGNPDAARQIARHIVELASGRYADLSIDDIAMKGKEAPHHV